MVDFTAITANLEPVDFMLSLGKTVRLARKAAELTQLELADLANVGKSAIFDIEKGKLTVQMSTLLSVLKVLHIELQVKAPIEAPHRREHSL